MKRNPNDPIPGFEEEFTGTRYNEKRIHKTHFEIPSLELRDKEYNTGYIWVRRGQRWFRVKKEIDNG
jgi:hypothetical protein